ncbi:Hypothetical predicted protein [Mytilus galloprovincialis]|uniref:Uncharacterized protein n=1 Tax=Mytilus galloprovincialis TaxID=29158 RepID=A0A8B6C890_MYTGA|nr:Hypothetical predicted protein [Mytilus galloprovincialis]
MVYGVSTGDATNQPTKQTHGNGRCRMDAFGDYEPTDEPHLMNQPVTRQQTDSV